MFTDRLRMVGLSGIDTDMLVGQLMKAESIKLWNLKKQNQVLLWQQEKYWSVSSNLKTFSNTYLDLISPKSIYASGTFAKLVRTVQINGKDTNAISVYTEEGTVNAKIQVLQLATKASAVSDPDDFSFANTITGYKNLDISGLRTGDKIRVNLDGTVKDIDVGELDKNNFAAALQEKLNVAFGRSGSNGFKVDATSGKLTISMYEKNHQLTITNIGTRTNSKTGSGTVDIDEIFDGFGTDSTDLDTYEKYTYKLSVNGKEINVDFEKSDLTGASGSPTDPGDYNTVAKKINDAVKAAGFSALGVTYNTTTNVFDFTSTDSAVEFKIDLDLSDPASALINIDRSSEARYQGGTAAAGSILFQKATAATAGRYTFTVGSDEVTVDISDGNNKNAIVAAIKSGLSAASVSDVDVDIINGVLTLKDTSSADRKFGDGSGNSLLKGLKGDSNSILKAEAGDYAFDVTVGSTTKTITIAIAEGDVLSGIATKINKELGNDADLKGLKADVSNGALVFLTSGATDDFKITKTSGSTTDLLAGLNADVPTGGIDLKRNGTLGYLGIRNGDTIHGTSGKTLEQLGLTELFKKAQTTPPPNIPGIEWNDTTKKYTLTLMNKNNTPVKIELTEADSKNLTLQEFMNKVNQSAAGINLTFNNASGIFKIEAKDVGVTNGFTAEDLKGTFFASILDSVATHNGDIVVTEAKNAAVSFDGVNVTTFNSNIFVHNNIEYTLNNTTYKAGEISWDGGLTVTPGSYDFIDIKVTKDSSKTLEVVREFVEKYNELIAFINGEVSTSRPRSGKYSYYEPLTDDEKKAMSDREIDLWEEKAKQGLLSRDSILSGITRDLRTALNAGVKLEDGTKLSLSNLGITTSSSYWEGGKLIIDEAKLAKALDQYGDKVAEMFVKTTDSYTNPELFTNMKFNGRVKTSEKVGLAERLRYIIDQEAMGMDGTLTRKAGVESRAMSLTTNDMYKRIKAQEDKIGDMLIRLAQKEDSYYAMFARMEAAVMQANNQMTYLMQQLGL